MDEGCKRVLLIAASILAARKLSGWSGGWSPAAEAVASIFHNFAGFGIVSFAGSFTDQNVAG